MKIALKRCAKLTLGTATFAICGLAGAQTTTTPPKGASEQQAFAETSTRFAADQASILAANVGNFVGGPGGSASGSLGNARRFALTGHGDTGAAGAPGGAAWNAWGAFSQNKVGYSFQPLQSSGTINVGMVGVDYRLANRMIVGVAIAGDRSDIALNFDPRISATGTLKGSGWTISPYLGVPLTRNLALDATLGVGRTKIDSNSGNLAGSFTADRTIGSIGLTYRETIGNWQLSGRGAFLSVSDRLGAYTLSNGTFVPGGSVDIQQFRFGGQAAYRINNVTPYVGLTYVYDIRRPDQQPVLGQSAANDRDAWVPTIGLRFSSGGSLYGGVQYSSEQSRSEVKNNQLLFNLGVRF